jgi:hypothetical protein
VGKNRSSINLIIITDQEVSLERLPPNVILYEMAEDELRSRLRTFLRDAFSVTADPLPRGGSMYKLCDYRPFFSLVFADALADRRFSHAGWCDSDLIFGNLSLFFPEPCAFDMIGRMGHFTALRNTAFFRELPLKIPGIRRHIADTATACAFDEVALWLHLSRYYVRRNKVSLCDFYDEHFADVIPEHLDQFLLYHEVPALPDQHFRYEDGRLLRVGGGRQIETVYAHFQKRPMEVRLRKDFRPEGSLCFVVRPNCFIHM